MEANLISLEFDPDIHREFANECVPPASDQDCQARTSYMWTFLLWSIILVHIIVAVIVILKVKNLKKRNSEIHDIQMQQTKKKITV